MEKNTKSKQYIVNILNNKITIDSNNLSFVGYKNDYRTKGDYNSKLYEIDRLCLEISKNFFKLNELLK